MMKLFLGENINDITKIVAPTNTIVALVGRLYVKLNIVPMTPTTAPITEAVIIIWINLSVHKYAEAAGITSIAITRTTPTWESEETVTIDNKNISK